MKKHFIEFDIIDQAGEQEFHGPVSVTASSFDREELIGLGEVRVDVVATQGDQKGEYIAEGSVTYTGDLECSRCVDPLPFAMTSAFTVRYVPRSAGSSIAEELEISDEDLDMEVYVERVVSLEDLSIQQIQLTLPMKPLCDDQCLGLCASCGGNLNRGRCNCDAAPPDSRWEGLAVIREELNKKTNM